MSYSKPFKIYRIVTKNYYAFKHLICQYRIKQLKFNVWLCHYKLIILLHSLKKFKQSLSRIRVLSVNVTYTENN